MIEALQAALAAARDRIAEQSAQNAGLIEQNAELKALVRELRDQIAALKKLPKRPPIKPSGMAGGAGGGRKGGGKSASPGRRGPKRPTATRRETCIVELDGSRLPPGSVLHGWRSFFVNDVVVASVLREYRRACYLTPAGRVIMAPLPAGVGGHFGAELRPLIQQLYHQGQMTPARVGAFLRGIGVAISDRQVKRLFVADARALADEADAVWDVARRHSAWISVDDTGARHAGGNGFCTQAGNDAFTWFCSRASKSRLNFLERLRHGHSDYVVNDAALEYMQGRAVPASLLTRLRRHEGRRFADLPAWQAHLAGLGVDVADTGPMSHARRLTEGALWGSIRARGLFGDTVILSDDAGQFNVGIHALCWIHMERLIDKLHPPNDRHRAAVARVRDRIWALYGDLNRIRGPNANERAELEQRFAAIFAGPRTGFASLDRLLRRLNDKREELLRVLDHPQLPLHTNGSEQDIRAQVTRRKISGGTRSDRGRRARDGGLAILKTCQKNRLSFHALLGDRLNVDQADSVPYLPDLVRERLTADQPTVCLAT